MMERATGRLIDILPRLCRYMTGGVNNGARTTVGGVGGGKGWSVLSC